MQDSIEELPGIVSISRKFTRSVPSIPRKRLEEIYSLSDSEDETVDCVPESSAIAVALTYEGQSFLDALDCKQTEAELSVISTNLHLTNSIIRAKSELLAHCETSRCGSWKDNDARSDSQIKFRYLI